MAKDAHESRTGKSVIVEHLVACLAGVIMVMWFVGDPRTSGFAAEGFITNQDSSTFSLNDDRFAVLTTAAEEVLEGLADDWQEVQRSLTASRESLPTAEGFAQAPMQKQGVMVTAVVRTHSRIQPVGEANREAQNTSPRISHQLLADQGSKQSPQASRALRAPPPKSRGPSFTRLC